MMTSFLESSSSDQSAQRGGHAGNTKVYFKGNEKNSLILSELVLLIEPQAAIEEIGFDKSRLPVSLLLWIKQFLHFLYS